VTLLVGTTMRPHRAYNPANNFFERSSGTFIRRIKTLPLTFEKQIIKDAQHKLKWGKSSSRVRNHAVPDGVARKIIWVSFPAVPAAREMCVSLPR